MNRAGKRVKDSIEAANIDNAKSSLRAAGYTLLEIKEQNALNKDIELPFLGNPKAKDMAIFCRQFQSILRAGVPVVQVLVMLGQQTENKKLAAAIRDMQASIEKGETLAGSMRKHNKIFSDMLINMVAAGEESGNLEESFGQMEIWFDKAKKTRSAITKAMVYPCILISVMVIVLIVMMVKVIPGFMQTFEEMDMELPLPTQWVMAASDWFVEWWWAVIIGLLVLIVGGVLLVLGNVLAGEGLGKITGIFGAIYNNVTGYFGDLLSYARLMALMLAGSVIAQVFNTIGAIPGNLFIFLLISIVGNALNLGLNLLGCFVHDLRLQCLEFFGKFYMDGGIAFRPLEMKTKYVNVSK